MKCLKKGIMNLPRILNYVAYVGVALVQIINGYYTREVGRFCTQLITRIGHWDVCPELLRWVLPFAASHAPMYAGLTLGIGFFALLCFLECGNEKVRAYIPICLFIALILAWLQIFFDFAVVYIPVEGMENRGHS